MRTYRFGLSFVNPKEKGFPASPRSQIYIKKYSADKNGTLFITPICSSQGEFEAQCNLLIKEIESIKDNAKNKYKIK